MLSLGSSLRVAPANAMANFAVVNGGRLVICNLQKTGMDSEAALIIHCKLDEMFCRLMKKLELPIPAFKLQRHVYLIFENETLFVEGITESKKPFDLFKSV